MRTTQGVEVDDGWVLLSITGESTRSRQTPQASVNACARPAAPPQPRRPVQAVASTDQAGGSSWTPIPECFPLSPSSSPKAASDFLALDSPPARPTEPTPAQVAPALGQEASTAALQAGIRRRASGACRAAEKEAVTAVATQASPSPRLEELEDSFVLVSSTPTTAARSFAFQHPRAATFLLWAWFTCLVLGELATTLWWFHSLGFRGLMVLCAPAGLALSFGLLTFGPEQMIAIAVAVALAAMPALPAYSAVLLMTAPGGSPHRFGSCWDILHWPMLTVLGMTYLVSALVPAIRAERPKNNSIAHRALQSLEVLQRLTQSACAISGWLYAAIVLHVGAARILTSGQQPDQAISLWYFWGGAIADPVFHGRGWVLTLHALGLISATVRQRTVAELGEDLLPCLFSTPVAQALTPRALMMHHGSKFLRAVPQLRRYTPPPMVVALVLAVKRTAPVLFPMLAILPQLTDPCLSMLLGLLMLVLLALAAAHEKRALPRSSLRRLPLLLPSGVAPCTRKLLGYALVAAEGIERTRRGVASLRPSFRSSFASLRPI